MITLYEDSLVRIESEALVVKKVFLPITIRYLSALRISTDKIESIEKTPLTPANGKYRIWGTSLGNSWWPFDLKRSTRDAAFTIHSKKRRPFCQIRFTVENAEAATRALRDINLLAQ